MNQFSKPTDMIGGQEDGYMADLQMDPAPSVAAGKDKPEKVWQCKKNGKYSSATGHHGSDTSPMHEATGWMPDDHVDESMLVTACGAETKKKGAFEIKHVPATFFTRAAFVELAAKDLAKVPPGEGWQIAYHSQTKRWHARTPSKQNYAPTWGMRRSELKALCLALQQLWDWYINSDPPDRTEADAHLARLVEFTDSIEF